MASDAQVEAMAAELYRRKWCDAPFSAPEMEDLRAALNAAERAICRRATDIPPPKDGDHALIYVVHENAKWAAANDFYLWQGWHTATWTDTPNPGWTWHGMLGTITHVRPQPPAPDRETSRG
jgi:hypothetical protein